MRREKEQFVNLPLITIKGHKLIPRVDGAGVFSVLFEDGDQVSATTLAALKTKLGKHLEKIAVEVRPNVKCLFMDRWDKQPQSATYVGMRKGALTSWSSSYMFDVNGSRQNLSKSNIEDKIYAADMDLKKLAVLDRAVESAEKELNKFKDAHRFDPTK